MNQVWGKFGCWISPCYSPFSLGGRFETYETFISLIFPYLWDRGEQRITEAADTESADIQGHDCIYLYTAAMKPLNFCNIRNLKKKAVFALCEYLTFKSIYLTAS
jgi:hypothetical protein